VETRLIIIVFCVLKTYLERVVDLDVGVRETDGPAVVGDDVWDLVLSDELLNNLAELEASFLGINGVGLETTLDVVENSEVLTSLGNGNDVHEAEGVLVVSSYSVVNFDVGILITADLDALLAGESVLKSGLKKNRERNAFAELMGSS
jgi:hypothetical protein